MTVKHVTEAEIVVPDHVIYRSFASDTVVLDLRAGVYYGLNATAGRMLELLEQTRDFTATANQLLAEYAPAAGDVTQDLRTFCSKLLEHGLIELA